MANGSIKISTEIDTSDAQQSFNELRSLIKEFGAESESELMQKLDEAEFKFSKLGEKLMNEKSNIESYRSSISDLNETLALYDSGGLEKDKGFTLAKAELEKVEKALKKSEENAQGLEIQMERVAMQTDKQVNKLKQGQQETEKINTSSKKVESSSKNTSKNIDAGVKKLGRYAMALFSIRSIYGLLSKYSNEWQQTNNAGAIQMKAQVTAMHNAIVNLIGPVLTYITNVLFTMMGYLNAILQFFFGISLNTKKAEKNVGGMGKGMKKANAEAKRFLARFDEIEKLTSDTSDNLGGMGSGMGGTATLDIKPPKDGVLKKFFDKLIKDLDPFIKTLQSINFDPLIDSVKHLGDAIMGVLDVMYASFIRIMNNAIGPFIKLMSEEIVPAAINAVADAIIALTPYFEYLMVNLVEPIIEWFLLELFPAWADLLISAFQLLTIVVTEMLNGFIKFWEFIQPFVVFLGEVLVGALKGVTDYIQELTGKVADDESEFGGLFETLGFVLAAFLAVKGGMIVVGGIMTGFTAIVTFLTNAFGVLWTIVKVVAGFLAGAFSGSILAIIALVALLVTALIGLATNFEQIKEDFFRIIENIKGFFHGLWEFIAGVFTGNWERAFRGLAEAVSNAFAGIVNIVKFPINIIVDGVNAMIRGLNKVKIPDWVPGVGGKGINIPQIPRLQRGIVTNRPMQAIVGDGGREAVVPLENDTRALEEIAGILAEHGAVGGSNGNITINLGTKTILKALMAELQKSQLGTNGGVTIEI